MEARSRGEREQRGRKSEKEVAGESGGGIRGAKSEDAGKKGRAQRRNRFFPVGPGRGVEPTDRSLPPRITCMQRQHRRCRRRRRAEPSPRRRINRPELAPGPGARKDAEALWLGRKQSGGGVPRKEYRLSSKKTAGTGERAGGGRAWASELVARNKRRRKKRRLRRGQGPSKSREFVHASLLPAHYFRLVLS